MLDLTPQELQNLLNVMEQAGVKGEANVLALASLFAKVRAELKALEEHGKEGV